VNRDAKTRRAYTANWCRRPPRYCALCKTLIDPPREPRQRKYHKACAVTAIRQQAAARQRSRLPTEATKATHRRAVLAYQHRHIAQGLCPFCSRRARDGRQTCRKHHVRRR
jgi:hypothetical protein